MTHIPKTIAISLSLCFPAFADRVITHEGRILHGKVSFGEKGYVKITADDETQSVTSSNLKRIIIDKPRVKPGLSDVSFQLYQGNWKQLPDFGKLTMDKSGRMTANQLDLSPIGTDRSQSLFNLELGERLDRWSAPAVEGRPFSISATVEACGDGVILAQGGHMDGYALYLLENHLHFVTRINRELATARDELPFPLNRPVKIIAELRRDLELVITVDGRKAANIESPGLIQNRPLEGLSAGFDQRPSLVGPYRNNHHFQGILKQLEVRLMGAGLVYAGKLNAPKSGEYIFDLSSNSSTRLEINGQEVIGDTHQEKLGHSQGSIQLTAGIHEIRVIYAQLITPHTNSAENHLSLKWSGPDFSSQTLSATPHSQTKTWKPADIAIPCAGITTSNGSFIAMPVKRVNASKVHFGNTNLDRKDVSILFLRQLSIAESSKLANKPPGALLMDGTYTEGRILSLDEKTVTVSSILFGIKRLERRREVAAIIIKPPSPATGQKSVRLHDSSLYFTRDYSVKDELLVMSNPLFKNRPIELAKIAEISHAPTPDHFQHAKNRWDDHSILGQHFLGERSRQNMKMVRQYREAQFRLVAAKKSMAESLRALPALAKAEEMARPMYEEKKAKYDALRDVTELRKKTHKPLAQAHANANRQLETNCEKTARARESLQNFILSRKQPLLETIDQIRNEIEKNEGAPKIMARLAAAEKQLATVEEQMVKPKTTLSQAIEAGLQADRAEHDAQLQEIDAWQALFEAQQAMKRIEVGYRTIEIDFLGKQSAANAVRQKMARAKRDGDLAIGQIGILEPILQEKLEK